MATSLPEIKKHPLGKNPEFSCLDDKALHMLIRLIKFSWDRLNYHHWIVKETLGYLIHPSIPTDRADLRILDVATGTGYVNPPLCL